MRITTSVTVTYGGRCYGLTADQWRRLSPQLKGLTAKERGPVGRAFLVEEGILKEGIGP